MDLEFDFPKSVSDPWALGNRFKLSHLSYGFVSTAKATQDSRRDFADDSELESLDLYLFEIGFRLNLLPD